jgi:hypothetical protein
VRGLSALQQVVGEAVKPPLHPTVGCTVAYSACTRRAFFARVVAQRPSTARLLARTSILISGGKVAFLFFRTQPAAGSYPQFCLLQPVHAAIASIQAFLWHL